MQVDISRKKLADVLIIIMESSNIYFRRLIANIAWQPLCAMLSTGNHILPSPRRYIFSWFDHGDEMSSLLLVVMPDNSHKNLPYFHNFA